MGKRSKVVWALAGCPDLNEAIKYGRSGAPRIERRRYMEGNRPPGVSRRLWIEWLQTMNQAGGMGGMAGAGGMGSMMGGVGMPFGMGGGGLAMGAPYHQEEFEAKASYSGIVPPGGYGAAPAMMVGMQGSPMMPPTTGVQSGPAVAPMIGMQGPIMAPAMGPAMAPTMNCPACMVDPTMGGTYAPGAAGMDPAIMGMYGPGVMDDPGAIDPVAAAMMQQQMMGGGGVGVDPYGTSGGYGLQ